MKAQFIIILTACYQNQAQKINGKLDAESACFMIFLRKTIQLQKRENDRWNQVIADYYLAVHGH